jgi:CRP-like cAMP-binding protein
MTHELFQGVPPDEVEKVLALGRKVRMSSGASLFRLGDPADCLYLINSGQVRLTVPMHIRGRDEDVLMEEKGPGQTVGWSALIPPYRFTLSAATSSETEAITLSREALHSFIEASPTIGANLCLNVGIVIGHRLQTLQAMWLREMQRTIELHTAAGANP